MNVFVAALHTNSYPNPLSARYTHLNDHEKSIVTNVPHVLESYHYVGAQKFVDAIRASGDKVFLDSGAFSAYTLKIDLSLPDYCKYIQENADIIRVEDGVVMASVLDGIGDPEETLQNQNAMEKLGVRPLPCFHAGEDEAYLEHYVKNYEYITLGGMVGGSTKQLMTWLDRMWDRYLTDGSGRPRLKVHGFGITAIPLMERYPWHSCDSSSWIQSAAFGSIITPEHGNMAVSSESPARHIAGQHISTFTPQERAYVHKMLADAGFNYERLSTVYESRAAYNIRAFIEINKLMNERCPEVFFAPQPEFF